MSKVITFVVPAGSGGVRDYADIMTTGLREAGNDARVFAWRQDQAHSIDTLIAESDCLYLQYSGYGYAKRGAPLWMLHYLQSRKAAIKLLGVFFHELYASGPPWGSAFWLSPVQRYIAVELAQLSDFWITNRTGSQQWLLRHAAAVPHALLPVISNVGESASYNPNRDPTAVVFGGEALRRKTWQAVGNEIFIWANRNGLTLHDIGPQMVDLRIEAILKSNGVIRHGKLKACAINQLLNTTRFGILAYPIEYVAKSSVLAAYCANGVAPILESNQHSSHDGLSEFQQFLPYSHLSSLDIENIGCIGQQAFRWYASHSIEIHLQSLTKIMRQAS